MICLGACIWLGFVSQTHFLVHFLLKHTSVSSSKHTSISSSVPVYFMLILVLILFEILHTFKVRLCILMEEWLGHSDRHYLIYFSLALC